MKKNTIWENINYNRLVYLFKFFLTFILNLGLLTPIGQIPSSFAHESHFATNSQKHKDQKSTLVFNFNNTESNNRSKKSSTSLSSSSNSTPISLQTPNNLPSSPLLSSAYPTPIYYPSYHSPTYYPTYKSPTSYTSSISSISFTPSQSPNYHALSLTPISHASSPTTPSSLVSPKTLPSEEAIKIYKLLLSDELSNTSKKSSNPNNSEEVSTGILECRKIALRYTEEIHKEFIKIIEKNKYGQELWTLNEFTIIDPHTYDRKRAFTYKQNLQSLLINCILATPYDDPDFELTGWEKFDTYLHKKYQIGEDLDSLSSDKRVENAMAMQKELVDFLKIYDTKNHTFLNSQDTSLYTQSSNTDNGYGPHLGPHLDLNNSSTVSTSSISTSLVTNNSNHPKANNNPDDKYKLFTSYTSQVGSKNKVWEEFLLNLYLSYKIFLEQLSKSERSKFELIFSHSLETINHKLLSTGMLKLQKKISMDFDFNLDINYEKLGHTHGNSVVNWPEICFWSTISHIFKRNDFSQKTFSVLDICLKQSLQFKNINNEFITSLNKKNAWTFNRTILDIWTEKWKSTVWLENSLNLVKLLDKLFKSGIDISSVNLSKPRYEYPIPGFKEGTSLIADLIYAEDFIGTNLLQYFLKNKMLDVNTPFPVAETPSGKRAELYPLQLAAMLNKNKSLQLLLQYGANPQMADKERSTALHLACENNALSTIKTLITHPQVNLNAQNGYGWTPLIIVSSKGFTEAAALLLQNPQVNLDLKGHKFGDDNSEIENQFTTALEEATNHKFMDIVSLILEKNPKLVRDPTAQGCYVHLMEEPPTVKEDCPALVISSKDILQSYNYSEYNVPNIRMYALHQKGNVNNIAWNENDLQATREIYAKLSEKKFLFTSPHIPVLLDRSLCNLIMEKGGQVSLIREYNETSSLIMSIDLQLLNPFKKLIRNPQVNLNEVETYRKKDYARHPITAISAKGLTDFAIELMSLSLPRVSKEAHQEICNRFIQYGTQFLKPEIVAAAIKFGGNVNSTYSFSSGRQTSLMVAVQRCRKDRPNPDLLKIVKSLLNANANPKLKDLDNKDVYHYAKKYCNDGDPVLETLALAKDNVIHPDFDSYGIHNITKNFYNEQGLNYDGFDIYGFNAEGIHEDTGTMFNPQGFKKVYLQRTVDSSSSSSSVSTSSISSTSNLRSNIAHNQSFKFLNKDNVEASAAEINFLNRLAQFKQAKYEILLNLISQEIMQNRKHTILHNFRKAERFLRKITRDKYNLLVERLVNTDTKLTPSLLIINPRMVGGYFPYRNTWFNDDNNYKNTILSKEPPASKELGTYLANIVAKYSEEYFNSYQGIWKMNPSFSPWAQQLLRERLYLTINHNTNYPFSYNNYPPNYPHGNVGYAYFSIASTIRRFLNGADEGTILFNSFTDNSIFKQYIDFLKPALDVESLINLVMNAAQAEKSEYSAKESIPQELLVSYARNHPKIGVLWTSKSIDNQYYTLLPNKKIIFKKDFFICLLTSYGFFLNY